MDGRPGAVCLYQQLHGAAHRHGAGAGFFHLIEYHDEPHHAAAVCHSAGVLVNFLFFTQEIGTSGSQYILGSHADGFAFWQHTNLVLLILGAVAFVLLLFCNVPEEAAAPADAPPQKGGYDWRIIVPYVLVFGFYLSPSMAS